MRFASVQKPHLTENQILLPLQAQQLSRSYNGRLLVTRMVHFPSRCHSCIEYGYNRPRDVRGRHAEATPGRHPQPLHRGDTHFGGVQAVSSPRQSRVTHPPICTCLLLCGQWTFLVPHRCSFPPSSVLFSGTLIHFCSLVRVPHHLTPMGNQKDQPKVIVSQEQP